MAVERASGMQRHFERMGRRYHVERRERPADGVVVTGYAQLSSLGGTDETWQGLLEGKSGIRFFDVNNPRTSIAAPVEFNPLDHYSEREMRFLSEISALNVVLCREAGMQAEILDEDTGKLQRQFKPWRAGMFTGSGVGPTPYLIDVDHTIHQSRHKETGEIVPQNIGAGRIGATDSLKTFPEQVNGQAAIALNFQGWGGTTPQACATGGANMNEAIDAVWSGKNDIAIGGGLELVLRDHADVAIGLFAANRRVLSTNNDNPENASRPFDRDRDGFVIGDGGGVVVFERRSHAETRGAKIYAEVLGYRNSMDGYDPTEMLVDNVIRTALKTLRDKITGKYYPVNAVFTHATATRIGDLNEAKMLRVLCGEYLKDVPVTAIKSMLGHLLGGAGSVNVIAAIRAIEDGKIPPISTLENPDPEVADLNFVRGHALEMDIETALALAYGFGGYNAITLLGKPGTQAKWRSIWRSSNNLSV